MAIWMGEAGGIRLGRSQSERAYSMITPANVNAAAKRFFFSDQRTTLVTGDQVWLRRVDDVGEPTSDPLNFIAPSGWPDGIQRSDGEWYVNTDSVGGIRLFRNWEDSINNVETTAVVLEDPPDSYRVSYEVLASSANCLAQTIGWTLNTDRDVADFTSLGDSFRQQMGTLVSGSGELECFFDAGLNACGTESGGREESAFYLHGLALRQEIGARFSGVFLMKQSNAIPIDDLVRPDLAQRELFYTAECVVTAIGTELRPTEPIRSLISFVTTGPIRLVFDYPSSYLLQEQPPNDLILQESGFGILLQVPG